LRREGKRCTPSFHFHCQFLLLPLATSDLRLTVFNVFDMNILFCYHALTFGKISPASDQAGIKKSLSERDICTKFILPAVKQAGWDEMNQIREEVSFTKGRIIVRGKLVTRGKPKRADCILYYKPNLPIALIEAKDNNHSVGDGMQQRSGTAIGYRTPWEL